MLVFSLFYGALSYIIIYTFLLSLHRGYVLDMHTKSSNSVWNTYECLDPQIQKYQHKLIIE